MKQAIKILALPCMGMALLFSASAMSAPEKPAANALPPLMDAPMRMPPFPGGHPPKPGFCHGGELFCATSASDNPVETINKLTAVIPAGSAKHYEVRVSVVAVPDAPPAP
ncbi:hypothetical protein K1Y38_05065 [Serratia marcescens]|uniref:hypothetical protein n=1 Tax=Serratia marcescens TaxID=615 RepID=UPI00223774B9|nr:hypothetical protein [Serratia marcescens]MCW6012276.1 hypothetical protein [Serratia marcescens]WEE05666.1 hypothetical protein PXW05_04365 [Serratia marcescens]WJD88850.1 hypothetical protein QRD25_04480 [Serratia marcescens]